jgi:hypothetical protein
VACVLLLIQPLFHNPPNAACFLSTIFRLKYSISLSSLIPLSGFVTLSTNEPVITVKKTTHTHNLTARAAMARRYEIDELIWLRDSPLVAKPPSLPPIEEWMYVGSNSYNSSAVPHRQPQD